VTQRLVVRNVRAYLGVGIGVLVVSTAATLIRLAHTGMPSLVIAAWRLTLATAILAPITLLTRRAELRTLTRREWGYVLGAGVLLALHFATWITSLAYTSVAASLVLVTTHPIFVGLASHLLLRERLSRGMVSALGMAIVGSVVIGLGDLGTDSHRLWGDVLALLGAVTVSGYFLIGRRLRIRLSLLAYVFPVYCAAAVVLILIVLFSGLRVLPQSQEAWLWLLLLAVGPQILGHSSLNWALRYLSAIYVTIAVLGEPIGATLLAWWLLGERPSCWALVGGALILVGIVVASRAEQPSAA
jgi:drug/metabolite transporter (DMT)-like permease